MRREGCQRKRKTRIVRQTTHSSRRRTKSNTERYMGSYELQRVAPASRKREQVAVEGLWSNSIKKSQITERGIWTIYWPPSRWHPWRQDPQGAHAKNCRTTSETRKYGKDVERRSTRGQHPEWKGHEKHLWIRKLRAAWFSEKDWQIYNANDAIHTWKMGSKYVIVEGN